MRTYDIYEEGFIANGESASAHYLGSAQGTDFLDACRSYIEKTGRGKLVKDKNGTMYACDWGCRWYPTLAEAQKSFG